MPGLAAKSTYSAEATPRGPAANAAAERGYRDLMPHVLYRLRCEFPGLEGDERLEIYNEVWATLLERSEAGFWPDDLRAWLTGAVVKRARAEFRKASRRAEPSDPFAGELALLCDRDMEEHALGALDAECYTAIIGSLSASERLVAKLRFDWGLSPREICEVTGFDRGRCYREIELATRVLRKRGRRVRRGTHVRGYEKLLRRYVAGTATAAERAEAAQLVEHSSQARMIATQMFRDARELGALLPAPVAGEAHVRGGALELVAGVKHQLLDGIAGAKQQATAAYVRASELPQQVGQHASALRPGGAAMAITGCLAIGGGTAACLVEGVNPAGTLYDTIDTGAQKQDKQGPPLERDAAAERPQTTTPTAAPTPAPRKEPTAPEPKAAQPPAAQAQPTPAAPAPPPPSQAAPSAPAPEPDFDFERSRPPTPRAPAPAPSKGGGEFF